MLNDTLTGWIVGGAIFSGLFGYLIGTGKGNGAAGLLLGALLGPLGWLLVAFMDASPAKAQAQALEQANLQRWAQTQVANQPAWHPDPYHRYARRWWDGARWTEHVTTSANTVAVDPI